MTLKIFSFYLTQKILYDSFSRAFQRNYTRIQSYIKKIIDLDEDLVLLFSIHELTVSTKKL